MMKTWLWKEPACIGKWKKNITIWKKKYEGPCRKRKLFFESSDIQRKVTKREFLQSSATIQMAKLAGSLGLKIKEIILTSSDTITEDKIDLKIEKLNMDREEKLLKSVFIKDKYNISNECYQSLNTVCQAKLPSLNQVNGKKKELNNIFNNYNNDKGTYTGVKEKLRLVLINLFEKKNLFNILKIIRYGFIYLLMQLEFIWVIKV